MLILLCFAPGCKKTKQVSNPIPPQKEEEAVPSVVKIVTFGDNLMHIPVINSGKQSDGTYNYSHLFENFQPMIKECDIAVMGQETIFGGQHLGYSGYPLFNSPTDVGKSLADEGFDVVLHASNHVLDKWDSGIENTLGFWENYPDITVLGINASPEEKETVDIVEKNGIKIAMMNYTYGTNSLVLPKGKEYMVNYIDREKIEKDLTYAEENADFSIVFIHWGVENSTSASGEQKTLALDMCSWGADLIVGSHPHVLQGAEWIESENKNKAFVYYSLGNYVSRQIQVPNLLGGISCVTVGRNGDKVEIMQAKLLPHVTHYNMTSTEFDVYPLKDYTDELASVHGVGPKDGAVTKQRFVDILENIFKDYDKEILVY